MQTPITLEQAKLHLRIDSTDEDALIDSISLAATEWCELYQNRRYVKRTEVMYLDKFPLIIQPQYSPLVSVTSIKYYDSDGTLQTLDSSYYRVDTNSEPGRITEAYGKYWPITRDMTNAVIITYIAGYSTPSNIPNDITAAIRLMIQYFYGRGSDDSLLTQTKNLLSMNRIITF